METFDPSAPVANQPTQALNTSRTAPAGAARAPAAASSDPHATDNHFRHMLDNVHLIGVMLDTTGAVTYINDYCLRLTGWQREEVIGQSWFDFFIPAQEPVREIFTTFMRSGEILPHYTNDILTRDGARRTVAWNNTILRNVAGEVIGTTSIGEDITERLRFEARLRESEEKYSKLFHHSNDAIIIHEMDGRILDVNQQALIQWGYSREEMLALTFADLHPPGTRGDSGTPLAHHGDQRTDHYEMEGVRKNGEEFLAEVSANQIEWSGRQIAQKIVRNITARKQAEKAVTIARDEALEASRIKSEFLATMSHEIRTPMNGIIGMAELLRYTNLDGEQQEFVAIIHSEAEALLAVINDILDFSKIDAGHIKLKQTEFDLVQVVEGVVDLLAPRARQRHLALMTFISPDIPTRLLGDAGRVRQVLLNLVGNAVKFTLAGEVVVHARVDAQAASQITVRITVTDTGIGIKPDDQARLFQPFSQADSSYSRRFGGTGLGLAISKRLVELMGGTIGVESSGVSDQGSTFWFTVAFEQATEGGAAPQTLPGGLHALVVSPSTRQREILVEYLQAWGVQVDSRANADAAIELLDCADPRHPYHVVLIDGALPGIIDHKFDQRTPREAGRAVPTLVLLTTHENLHQRETVTALGFTTHLTKPVKQARILDILEQVAVTVVASSSQVRTVPQSEVHAMGPTGTGLQSDRRILLVEDNETNRTLVVRQLTKLGISVEIVATGEAAVASFIAAGHAGSGYDLVLMDVQMPAMDGLQATRLMRQAEQALGDHVPIVAITAYATEEDRQLCLAAGMDDYLAKPVTLKHLQRILERWLAPR